MTIKALSWSWVARLESFNPEISIDHVSLAYWMDVASVSQEYVLPVYEFRGTCRAANGNLLDNFTGWIEALK
jgi:hypothetical protein